MIILIKGVFILNKKLIRKFSCLALIFVLLGGIMGIEKFNPEERTLDIIETISLEAPAPKDENAVQTAALIEEEMSQKTGLDIAGKAAILIDAESGTVMYSKNADTEYPPASVTKIMTMLLVLEACDRGQINLDDVVTISERAASMGGSQMYMEPGEQHTVEELMKGVAMVSANDGCVALAEYLAGTEEIFVENMNKRAKELEMEHTNFVNTNGLPVENHYTTARDISIMSRELLKYTAEHQWFTTWQDNITVGLPGKETEFGLTNTNKLIKQYNGANGIKTGYTAEAGYCLSASATRENLTLIAVVLGCDTSKTRLAEITKMLDYGFAAYEGVKLAEKGQIAGAIEIPKGEPKAVNILVKEDIFVLTKKGEIDGITTEIKLNEEMEAPIVSGTTVGEMIVKKDGKEYCRCELVTESDVEKASIFQRCRRSVDNIFN